MSANNDGKQSVVFAMNITKPAIPKGTRDFSPLEMNRRNYIFDTIRSVFGQYGYQPIETPAMENLSTLLGKYGEEGDKLLFRILNSGDFLSGVDEHELKKDNAGHLSHKISEKGLRYDLTVPFARYVVQHRNDITFPFKRYQIQPVWRADRPQKGRYREFYQCDADVVGSDAMINEAELLLIAGQVFSRLGIKVVIKLNNRKILSGIAELIGYADKITDITVAIDKLDKIGTEKVNEELAGRGISREAIEKLQPVLHLQGSNTEKLGKLKALLSDTADGPKGIEEISEILDLTGMMHIDSPVELDLTLARGLNYYTGAIIEVKATGVAMGSISGGGRYDNLTGIFGLPGVSGVGISFGADRIYDVMNELNLFPAGASATTKVLFVNFGREEEKVCIGLAAELRKNGINTEVYPDPAKLKKQFSYADTHSIPWVVIIGEEERAGGKVVLKNMISGEQRSVEAGELMTYIR
ncbi:histidine--tRNA ligase [Lentimicrobium sp.]|uniref:histidine--tRNA ligase n=4 Tax=Lentimicrobium sp. TaxID=2034841 RepID=UPI002C65C6A3|nr:histidine--tRNA ligase [Lentimicrobium sp.]HOP12602.1 histidine--tRNA ligase [Lentimicrobium sp.]HPF65012.1 histidine--tRNA ligase [Lentimicrobium sp.]HPR26571.1 histidine--tRNA ligase [Lentimicrobium sp.]